MISLILYTLKACERVLDLEWKLLFNIRLSAPDIEGGRLLEPALPDSGLGRRQGGFSDETSPVSTL